MVRELEVYKDIMNKWVQRQEVKVRSSSVIVIKRWKFLKEKEVSSVLRYREVKIRMEIRRE